MLWLHVPGFDRPKKETRYGDGQVITDFAFWLIIDSFLGAGKQVLIKFLKMLHVTEPILLLTHAHGDHGNGFFDILNDSFFHPKALICYKPSSLEKGLRNNKGSQKVKDDIAYLESLIALAKKKGVPVIYAEHGQKFQYGDIRFYTYRWQPSRVEDNDIHGWDYVNEGSICCYFPELNYWTSADGPDEPRNKMKSVGAKVLAFLICHHGNFFSQSNAQGLKKDGAVVCWYNDLEPNGIGTEDFTAFGARRCLQAGIEVFESVGDINALFFGGTAYWYHGGKQVTYKCGYAGKSILRTPPVDVVRKILRGEYGSGDTRVTKVIAAGFGPKTTQSKVNSVISIAKLIKEGKANYGKNEARLAKIDKELGKGYGQLVQDYINVLFGVREKV